MTGDIFFQDQIDAVEEADMSAEETAARRERDVRILEALLFASAQPLGVRELHARMPAGADVGGALMTLEAHYKGRGVTLVEMDGHWAFRTAADLSEALTIDRDVERKLSRAALETLAIIAYHQPITRAEVENIRGVATHKGTLDALMEAGWIKPGRRREAPGRPLTWITTPEFLDHFSLGALTDLPGIEELKATGLLDRRPAIEAIPQDDDLFAAARAAREQAANDDENAYVPSSYPSDYSSEEESA